uniref:Cazy family gt29 n=1 Tax=Tetraselmis sp. GSL018 TaxID=582737 RepID=A0A061RIJ1_9CHLO|mmetsp:Transcript_39306/g.93103  ORF Transcript_39306/g.93103 Transcript_39306/m.93103 type:complete len:168 (-) Transcript_39306:432-935(-)
MSALNLSTDFVFTFVIEEHRGKRNREDSEKTGRNSRPLETIRDEVRQKLSEIRFVNQYNRLITHRRQFIIWNATLKSIIQRHFLEYFDDQTGSTLVYAFPSKLMALLPMDEPLLDYETCAVVGNSGVTLLRLDGKDIDGHDAVFRINLAPVRGFEDHVGSKTTFQVR